MASNMKLRRANDKIIITAGDLDAPGSCQKIELTIYQAEALLEVLPRMIGEKGENNG